MGKKKKDGVLVSWVCHNKVPQTEWLKQQKFFVLSSKG